MHICRRGWWCFGGMGALRIFWKPPWTERRFAKLQEQSRVSPKGWMLTVQFDEASQVIPVCPLLSYRVPSAERNAKRAARLPGPLWGLTSPVHVDTC